MKKINTVEEAIEILAQINKKTVKSYIEDSGFGPIYMRKGGAGLGRSPRYHYCFGSKKIETKEVSRIISLFEKFPNDFVWIKHEDIYILMFVNSLIPGIQERPQMIIAFSPAHFNNEKTLTEKLEELLNKKENKDRCKLFKVNAFDCKYPSKFEVIYIHKTITARGEKEINKIFKEFKTK